MAPLGPSSCILFSLTKTLQNLLIAAHPALVAPSVSSLLLTISMVGISACIFRCTFSGMARLARNVSYIEIGSPGTAAATSIKKRSISSSVKAIQKGTAIWIASAPLSRAYRARRIAPRVEVEVHPIMTGVPERLHSEIAVSAMAVKSSYSWA
jgi:hypothetical protein